MSDFCRQTLLETLGLITIVGTGSSNNRSNIQKILAGVVVYIVLPELRKKVETNGSYLKIVIDFLRYVPLITALCRMMKKNATKFITESLEISAIVFYRKGNVLKEIGNVPLNFNNRISHKPENEDAKNSITNKTSEEANKRICEEAN